MVPLESVGTVSYSHFITTMALSSIIAEIKRDIGRKLRFSHTLHLTRPLGGPRRNISTAFVMESLEWCGYPKCKNFEDMFSRFDRIPACDRRTDRQTYRQISCGGIVRAMHNIAR